MWFAHARPENYCTAQCSPIPGKTEPGALWRKTKIRTLSCNKQQQHLNSTQTFSNMFSSNLSLLCRRLHLPPPLHPPLPPHRQALRTLAGAQETLDPMELSCTNPLHSISGHPCTSTAAGLCSAPHWRLHFRNSRLACAPSLIAHVQLLVAEAPEAKTSEPADSEDRVPHNAASKASTLSINVPFSRCTVSLGFHMFHLFFFQCPCKTK